MNILAQMLGALLPTLLLSRLFLFVFKKRHWSAHRRILLANGISLALGWILRAAGDANGGDWQWGSGVINVLPQLVWYLWDRRKLRAQRMTETV